jgi:hypothetical protein
MLGKLSGEALAVITAAVESALSVSALMRFESKAPDGPMLSIAAYLRVPVFENV